MQQGQRGYFWVAFQAVVLAALFAFVVAPHTASAHTDSGPDIHSTVEIQQNGNPVAADPYAMFGHCHSGLDCSVQAVFVSGNDARFIDADLRLTFRSVDNTMASRPVSFDPPPPRILP